MPTASERSRRKRRIQTERQGRCGRSLNYSFLDLVLDRLQLAARVCPFALAGQIAIALQMLADTFNTRVRNRQPWRALRGRWRRLRLDVPLNLWWRRTTTAAQLRQRLAVGVGIDEPVAHCK